MRTIVFEIPAGVVMGAKPFEVLVEVPEIHEDPATVAFRQPTATSSGTWGVPFDAVKDTADDADVEYGR